MMYQLLNGFIDLCCRVSLDCANDKNFGLEDCHDAEDSTAPVFMRRKMIP